MRLKQRSTHAATSEPSCDHVVKVTVPLDVALERSPCRSTVTLERGFRGVRAAARPLDGGFRGVEPPDTPRSRCSAETKAPKIAAIML